MYKNLAKKRERGFTLIEMMVASGIFAILMVVSVGAMLNVMDANSKAQAMKSVINNLNFAVETMARNLRTGTSYHCDTFGPIGQPQDCSDSDGASFIAFEPAGGSSLSDLDQIMYQYDPTAKQILRITNGGSTVLPLTAPEVIIDDLRFHVIGAMPGDLTQPKVIITVRGHAGIKGKVRSDFNLQTTVTQRLLDS